MAGGGQRDFVVPFVICTEHLTMTRECTVVPAPDVVLHECLRTVLPFTVETTVEQLLAVPVADELA